LPYSGGWDAHTVADGRTNTKCIPFNEILESAHTANLKNPMLKCKCIWQYGDFFFTQGKSSHGYCERDFQEMLSETRYFSSGIFE
jgi:hypothetical protein